MTYLSEHLNVYIDPTGKAYRRVTSIIKDLYPSEYAGIPQRTLDNAADRGIEVEGLITEYLRLGYLDQEIRTDAVPRMEAFVRFTQQHQIEYISHQITVFDYPKEVAGTLDFFLKIDGHFTIMDLKCCAKPIRTWPLQVGAYASMKECDRVGVLQLDGKKHIWHVYDRDNCIAQWTAAYNFWSMNQCL